MFRDRDDAGRQLAQRLVEEDFDDPLVLALPRGGVPVAAQVASALGAPLMAFVARKLGAPGQPELGIGAIAEGSDEVVVTPTARRLGLDDSRLSSLVEAEQAELRRRLDHYRGGAPLPDIESREVILVDDGLATGVTAEAALRALRRRGPRRLVLAIPVCAPESATRLAGIADDVVYVASPPNMHAIGAWYDDFTQTSDAEVLDLLDDARESSGSGDTSA
jgi:putative phosphoribosyl transferase